MLLLITGELAPANVLGFCVAASNAFGLIAGIFLMGYGLVAVPRSVDAASHMGTFSNC